VSFNPWWKVKNLNAQMASLRDSLIRDVMGQVHKIDAKAQTEWDLLEEGMKWRPPAKKNF